VSEGDAPGHHRRLRRRRGVRRSAFAPPADLLSAACPAPDRSAWRPVPLSAAMHPGFGAAAGRTLPTPARWSLCVKLLLIGDGPFDPPPCPWRDGRAAYSEECRRAARGGVTRGRPSAGSGPGGFHRPV